MPKKNKKQKNSKNNKGPSEKRALLYKEDGQDYALVLKILGGYKIKVKTNEGLEYIGRIRGKIRKRCRRMQPDDYVLIAMRDYENIVDIIHKYDNDEVRRLKKMGEIMDFSKFRGGDIKEEEETQEEDIGFDFEEI